MIENGRVSERRLQRLPGTRVEPAPNSEYAPISEMRLITRDYGIVFAIRFLSSDYTWPHETTPIVLTPCVGNV